MVEFICTRHSLSSENEYPKQCKFYAKKLKVICIHLFVVDNKVLERFGIYVQLLALISKRFPTVAMEKMYVVNYEHYMVYLAGDKCFLKVYRIRILIGPLNIP